MAQNLWKLAFLAAIGAAPCGAGIAQEGKTPKTPDRLTQMLRGQARQAFAKADVNRDGSLDQAEFAEGMEHFRRSLAQLRGQTGGAGKKAGSEEKSESAKSKSKSDAESKAAAEKIFAAADGDSDGKVSEREFTVFIEKAAAQLLRRIRDGKASPHPSTPKSKAKRAGQPPV